MQIKIRRYHDTPIRMVKRQNLTKANDGKDGEQQELSFAAGGNQNATATVKSNLATPYKAHHMIQQLHSK